MNCFCNAVVISTTPACPGRCLRLSTLRIGCDDGPTCNETVQLDLSEYNDVSDGVNVKYKLTKDSYAGFTSVTLTEAGILTFTTDGVITPLAEEEITYKVYEDGGLLSDTATVYVCSVDKCKGQDPCLENQTCNPCDGLCEDDVDLEIVFPDGPDLEIT